ncbi:MAG: class I SAM-dependent methyltransferase [Bacteroidetes bacterium]|nr:class I SAM-dependent methyltransferase [Bacteroidota bacterium]
MKNSLNRFSSRVENYVKYRPHYPVELISFLKGKKILTSKSVIADIGSGTGISSELFLKNGNVVFGVEPNMEMRKAAEKSLAVFSNFKSVDGTAEETTLENQMVDIIVAGQAFHWFDLEKCKIEFKRILNPKGTVVLIWNDRRTQSTPFLIGYENLLQTFGTDYREVDHKNIDEKVFNNFFGEGNFKSKTFENFQHYDYDSLEGRLLSSSYVPNEGHHNYQPMINALKELFIHYQHDNTVTIEYDTIVYYGKLI